MSGGGTGGAPGVSVLLPVRDAAATLPEHEKQQDWGDTAEQYREVDPTVSIAVTGGGSGTGIAALIIGGSTVSSAPWAAAVFSNGSFTCSGTIIAPQWVLTARHCLGGSK